MVLAGLWRAQVCVVDGVVEAHGPALAWLLSRLTLIPGGAAAVTLGHVVIARDSLALEWSRAHERVHVRQCETWGPLFVPAYLSASLWATLRGGNFYFDNRSRSKLSMRHETSPGPREQSLESRRKSPSGAKTRSRSTVHQQVETLRACCGHGARPNLSARLLKRRWRLRQSGSWLCLWGFNSPSVARRRSA